MGCFNCGNETLARVDCDNHLDSGCQMVKCLNCNCSDRDCENEMEIAK